MPQAIQLTELTLDHIIAELQLTGEDIKTINDVVEPGVSYFIIGKFADPNAMPFAIFDADSFFQHFVFVGQSSATQFVDIRRK